MNNTNQRLNNTSNTMRLQRFLARAGVASRRKSEELIVARRVSVNGRIVCELGSKVNPTRDRVALDKRPIRLATPISLVLNKPDNTVTTAHDPEGRATVMDLIPQKHAGIFPIGRLDYHTLGVLLLTNDGDLAAALAHPSREIPRVYHVKVRGTLSSKKMATLAQGIDLGGKHPARADVKIVSEHERYVWVEMIIRQGINRQIHRMLEAVESTVLKLKRVSFANITAKGLRQGTSRQLTAAELTHLQDLITPSPERQPSSERQPRPERKGPPPRHKKKQGRKTTTRPSKTRPF